MKKAQQIQEMVELCHNRQHHMDSNGIRKTNKQINLWTALWTAYAYLAFDHHKIEHLLVVSLVLAKLTVLHLDLVQKNS